MSRIFACPVFIHAISSFRECRFLMPLDDSKCLPKRPNSFAFPIQLLEKFNEKSFKFSSPLRFSAKSCRLEIPSFELDRSISNFTSPIFNFFIKPNENDTNSGFTAYELLLILKKFTFPIEDKETTN